MGEVLELPRVIAGVMRWGDWGAKLTTDQLQALIEGCLEAGVRCFDHADIYGHYTEEAAFGRVLAKAPELRKEMLLVTKCGINLVTPVRPHYRVKSYDSSKAHIISSAEQSLRALNTEQLDVLLLHRPDMLLDADEAAEAFQALSDSGKVRAFGVSNFTPHQFELLASRWPNLLTNQVELSLKHISALTDGTLDQAQRLRLRPMIWSPLGGGNLFGEGAGNLELSLKLAEVAERHSTTADVVAYAWVMMHPTKPSVVTGSSKLKRIRRAQAAVDLRLTRQDWYELLEAARGEEVA